MSLLLDSFLEQSNETRPGVHGYPNLVRVGRVNDEKGYWNKGSDAKTIHKHKKKHSFMDGREDAMG